jgi:5-methylcytosine-specific restriction endonuclease McrA
MLDNVLVLNANFEPINICTVRRAVGLIITDKAALVVNGRGYIHTINQIVPRPSIIRLQHMVNRPRLRVKLNRREIFRRDNFTCQYCGKQGGNLTIDHVYPRHLGGQHLWNNVVTACAACNHRKGGRTLKESGMQLARLPREPQASAEYVFGRHLSDYDDWLPFLQGW